MSILRVGDFRGELPKFLPRLLPDNFGQLAVNSLLTSGALEPWQAPLDTGATLVPNALTVYRMYDLAGNSYWLSWDELVDAVKSPIAADETHRMYFTSGLYEPRQTNLELAVTTGGPAPYPNAFYVLGVFPPDTAATVAPTGGVSSTEETRTYVYTFVTPWGEESEPSPASQLQTGKIDATWGLSAMDVAPPNSGNVTDVVWGGGKYTITLDSVFGLRAGEQISLTITEISGTYTIDTVDTVNGDITIVKESVVGFATTGTWARVAPHNTTGMTKRIYRLVSGAATPTYYFVGEIPVATTTFNDTTSVVPGEPIPSIEWLMPPTKLKGIVMHPSGATVGFVGNELYASVPYRGFAFPDSYRLNFDYDIVGLGVFGTSIVVCTEGTPYIVTGNDPAFFTTQKLEFHWPCLSKTSIASVGGGVMYATPQGVALIAPSGSQIVTNGAYTMREFSLLQPDSFISAPFDGGYYAAYRTSADTGGLLTITVAPEVSISRSNYLCDALYTDPQTNELYILVGGNLSKWGANPAQRLNYDWWSKEFSLPRLTNLSSAKVDANFYVTQDEVDAWEAIRAATIAANQAYVTNQTAKGDGNAHPMNTFPLNGSLIKAVDASLTADAVQFSLYSDGQLMFSLPVMSNEPFRLPSGFRYEYVSVRVSGTAPIRQIFVASSIAELAEV